MDAYAEWQESRMLESRQQALEDSLFFVQTRNRSGIALDENAWEPLLTQHANDRLYSPTDDRMHSLLPWN
jgi:hypothetical protein